jgi:hypothetical protein
MFSVDTTYIFDGTEHFHRCWPNGNDKNDKRLTYFTIDIAGDYTILK